MINFQQITLNRGQRVLFENVSFTLHDKQKVGLVGANGSGKSSLLAVLLGELDLTSGEISFQGQLRLAHVAQETPALETSALSYVLEGDVEYSKFHQAIEIANKNQEYEKLAELHAQFAAIDGYAVPAKTAQLLMGLGFDATAQQQPVSSFSGGWRMRLNLARALICRSDALLLDEPTNHLDLTAIIWLEKWLQKYSGTLVIISHDREFLDKVISYVVHISQQTIKLYSGNYSTFEAERARQLALQQVTYEKQQKKIKHLMKFVDRFRYKSSKAKQAQSRLKAIDRMDQIAAVQAESPFEFEFKQSEKCPYPILDLKEATLQYGDKTILQSVTLQLIPGDRVALLGPNGAGKSTLLKALIGELPLSSGTLSIDKSVKIGYFSQHQLETLSLEKNAFEHMRELAPQKSMQELRNYLGGFGFSGDMVLAPVKNFSGGEKSRLVLAIIVWQRPNLLLLDEPTNHLDMEMRMALMMALQSFEGALILVSHDRHLIRNTVDKLYLIANGDLKTFNGDLDDYKEWVLQHYQQQLKAADKESAETKPAEAVATNKKAKKLNAMKVAEVEREITRHEQALQTVAQRLERPELYQADQLAERDRLYAEQKRLQQLLQSAEEKWMQYHVDSE